MALSYLSTYVNAASGLDCIGFGDDFINRDKSCTDLDARAICEGP